MTILFQFTIRSLPRSSQPLDNNVPIAIPAKYASSFQNTFGTFWRERRSYLSIVVTYAATIQLHVQELTYDLIRRSQALIAPPPTQIHDFEIGCNWIGAQPLTRDARVRRYGS